MSAHLEQLELAFETVPTVVARATPPPVYDPAVATAVVAAPSRQLSGGCPKVEAHPERVAVRHEQHARPCRCERPLYALDEYDDQRCIRCGRGAA